CPRAHPTAARLVLTFYMSSYRHSTRARPPAGDPRPSRPEDARARAEPRPRDRAPDRADHARHVPPTARLAVPGAPPARGEGLARVRVGRVGEPAACEVLPADPGRAAPPRRRGRELGADRGGDALRPGDEMMR